MVLGNTLNILRPPGKATVPVQTGWNEDLVKNMHEVLGRMSQQISATTTVSNVALTNFATKALLEAATIPLVVTAVQLTGYTADGDGGDGLYKRVGSEPSHAFKIQSADGAWWEIVPGIDGINLLQNGAAGDGTTDDGTKLSEAIDFAVASGGGQIIIPAGLWRFGAYDKEIVGNVSIKGIPGKTIVQQTKTDTFILKTAAGTPQVIGALSNENWGTNQRVTRVTMTNAAAGVFTRFDVVQVYSEDLFDANADGFYSELAQVAFIDPDDTASAGNTYVWLNGQLFDLARYSTSPKMREIDVNSVDLSVNGLVLRADDGAGGAGDIHNASETGRAHEQFKLLGFKGATVDIHVLSSWQRGLLSGCCWRGDFKVRGDDLPNLPNSNVAFGYVVQEVGANFGNRFEINAGICRHAYTTGANTETTFGSLTANGLFTIGTPAYSHVTGTAVGTLSNAWDTHAMGWGITFHGCKAMFSRTDINEDDVSNLYGFQDRARRGRWFDCESFGSTHGILVDGTDLEDDAAGVTIINNFSHIGNTIQQDFSYAIDVIGVPTGDVIRKIWIDGVHAENVGCLIRCRNDTVGGHEVSMRNVVGRDIHDCFAQIDGDSTLRIDGFHADLLSASGSPSTVEFIHMGAGADLKIYNGSILGASQITGLFRTASGTSTVEYSGFRADASVTEHHGAGATTISYPDSTFGDLILRPSSSLTPVNNGDFQIEIPDNESLFFKFKGSDGTVRSIDLTLT